MTRTRLVLTLRSPAELPVPPKGEAGLAVLRRAIATRTYILATYNKGRVKLAPYVLYERDDAHFLDAVTVEREGRAPRELKLGAFRLSGLSDLCLGLEQFSPDFPFAKEDPRHAQRVLARI